VYPDNLKYTKNHEWVRVEESTVTVGITQYAQEQLGDIVFVELPEPGDSISRGEVLGSIESVKSVSEVYSPVSGEVVEVNEALLDQPEMANEDPYGNGWLVKFKPSNVSEIEELMDAGEYEDSLK